MNQRMVILVLGLFLFSYLPISDYDEFENSSESSFLNLDFIRTEISPNPDTMSNLDISSVYFGPEDTRDTRADSSIGVYTNNGL
ncbi:MAG: hypothetical protein ACKVGY_00320, partial [Candidatus Poseidoniales archaeon]